MILHYIVEENNFVVIVCELLDQQKNWNIVLKIAIQLILNKLLKCLRRLNILNSKILGKKIPLTIYAVFESVLAPEDNVKQNSNESYTNKYQK